MISAWYQPCTGMVCLRAQPYLHCQLINGVVSSDSLCPNTSRCLTMLVRRSTCVAVCIQPCWGPCVIMFWVVGGYVKSVEVCGTAPPRAHRNGCACMYMPVKTLYTHILVAHLSLFSLSLTHTSTRIHFSLSDWTWHFCLVDKQGHGRQTTPQQFRAMDGETASHSVGSLLRCVHTLQNNYEATHDDKACFNVCQFEFEMWDPSWGSVQ